MRSKAERKRRTLILTAFLCGVSSASSVALAQTPADTMTVDTAVLGMTGWNTDPAVVETAVLGMTGWRTAPMTVDAAVLGMTGWRTAPATVETAVFGMTGWAPYHIVCKPKLEVMTGTLDLRDPNGSACPRHAEAALSLKTNVAGPVPFSLDCTGNRSWSQTATSHETAPSTYIAIAILPFDIKHKEHINCALKSQLRSPPKIVALRGHIYNCAKTGPDRVVTGVPPTTGEPPRVIDPPRPVCTGGKLLVKGTKSARYACHCPAGQTALSTGPNSYLCQRNTAAGITCTGGTIRNGQCLCPSNMQKTQAGTNAWRCQRRGASAGRVGQRSKQLRR